MTSAACPMDGFFERAAITVGSMVLTDPDGRLRETDVGKNIAVPGAADLVATIARLVGRKDVENASMTAGQQVVDRRHTAHERERGKDRVREPG